MNCLYKFLTKKILDAILILFFIFYINSIKSQSRLYISNDNHTDYMWSANVATYDSAFVNMLDAWMAINNTTNSQPPDYQTKFNCDGTY